MATTEPVSEEEIGATLRTDPNYAFELLDVFYREQILQYIKRVTWSRLRPDELMVVYQETMLAFIRRVREDDFDPARPLRLVYWIARHRGYDFLRARRRHRMNTNEEELLGAVADSLKNTETGDKWTLLSPAERKEFKEIVLQVVATLPERQQIVARCYVDCFEVILNEGSFRILSEEVGRVTGKQENVVSVKSAWHAALKKIGPALERRGFNFTIVE